MLFNLWFSFLLFLTVSCDKEYLNSQYYGTNMEHQELNDYLEGINTSFLHHFFKFFFT